MSGSGITDRVISGDPRLPTSILWALRASVSAGGMGEGGWDDGGGGWEQDGEGDPADGFWATATSPAVA